MKVFASSLFCTTVSGSTRNNPFRLCALDRAVYACRYAKNTPSGIHRAARWNPTPCTRSKMEMRGVLSNQPRGTRKGTKNETEMYHIRIRWLREFLLNWRKSRCGTAWHCDAQQDPHTAHSAQQTHTARTQYPDRTAHSKHTERTSWKKTLDKQQAHITRKIGNSTQHRHVGVSINVIKWKCEGH